MGLIERTRIIENAIATLTSAGPPTNGTSAVQTLTVTGTPTGGTLTLSLFGQSVTVPYNATAAAVAAALTGLPGLGGTIAGSGGPLPGSAVVLTFQGQLSVQPVPLVVANGALLTGGASPSAAVANTTPGVLATGRTSPAGTICEDQTVATGELWQNQGAFGTPAWVKVGTQT